MNSIDEYFNNPAISQSDLILLGTSPKMFKDRKDGLTKSKETDAMRFGSAVDCLLTDKDCWDDRFYVMSIDKPAGQMLTYTELLLENSKETAYFQTGFKRDSLEKVEERFEKEGREYYKALKDSKNKTVLNYSEYENVVLLSNSFLEEKGEYFNVGKDEEILFQTPIYFICKGVKCKALLDIIKISHKEKTIKGVDIKTARFIPDFITSVFKYRYDIQGAWYREALLYFMAIGKTQGYTILPFEFLVGEKAKIHKPVVFNAKNIITTGKYGGRVDGKWYIGYEKLLDMYIEEKAKDKWEYGDRILNIKE